MRRCAYAHERVCCCQLRAASDSRGFFSGCGCSGQGREKGRIEEVWVHESGSGLPGQVGEAAARWHSEEHHAST